MVYYNCSHPLPFNCKNPQFDPWGNGTISPPNTTKLSKNASNAQVQYMKLVEYIHGSIMRPLGLYVFP